MSLTIFSGVRHAIAWFSRRERLSRRLLAEVRFPQGNGLVVRDANLKVILCNATLLRVFAVNDGLPMEGHLEDYFRSEVALFLQGLDEEALKGRMQAIGVLPPGSAPNNPRGSYRVATTPIYSKNWRFEGVVSVFADQSELHLAEQALYSTQQRYRLMYDAIPLPSGVFEVDYSHGGMLTLRLMECNQGLLELMEARPIPFDVPAAEAWPVFRETALLEGIARLMGGGPQPLRYEFFSGLFGRTFEMSLTRFGEGRLLIFLRDVTDLRQSEDQVLRLHHQLRGSLAEQHKRTTALLEDANQFMHTVSERLDDVTASMGGLAENLPQPARAKLGHIGSVLQAHTEKMLRYAGVGMLPNNPKLTALQEVMGKVCRELSKQFPHVEFECDNLPSLVVSADALLTAIRILLDVVVGGDHDVGPRRVVMRAVPDFAETAFALDFYGFSLGPYIEAMGDETEIEVSWEHFASLRLAAVRRILAFYGGVLVLTIAHDGAVRFTLKSVRPQESLVH